MPTIGRSGLHRIVVVGGGAAGLELVTRLGDTLGKRGRAEIVLVEKARTHVWKPLLHAVAAGGIRRSQHELNYLAQAHWHHFTYRFGALQSIDRAARQVCIGATTDEEGREITPPWCFGYDTLVVAVGSVTNDWGQGGAPRIFEDYAERYPPIAHGAKRHLTLPWTPGLSAAEVARKAGCSVSQVRRAIDNGTLSAETRGRTAFVTRTDATRWISRGSPAGDTQKSWISLETAQQRYLFTSRDLKAFIASGALKSKTGTHGAMRGIVYVSKAQCAKLREEIGFTEQEAARRAKITVPQLREALPVVNWRGTGAIPLATVQAGIKRLQSNPGYTLEEAADLIGEDAAWVEDRIKDGTVRPLRTKHDHARLYLSEPMIRRLRAAIKAPRAQTVPRAEWLRLGEAALEAGVTTATIIKWAECRELARVADTKGWRYPRDAVRARARAYWRTSRFRRATPPQWLGAENTR